MNSEPIHSADRLTAMGGSRKVGNVVVSSQLLQARFPPFSRVQSTFLPEPKGRSVRSFPERLEFEPTIALAEKEGKLSSL